MSKDIPAPPEFFDGCESFYPELFEGVEFVWQVLPRIKPFVESLVKELGGLGAMKPGLVAENTVIHEGRAVTGGIGFEPGDATKGAFRVFVDREEVKDAALIFQGAYILGPDVYLGPGAVVEPGAMIKGPCVIGPGCEVRQGAYIRGSVLTGSGCVIGHATEVKNALFFKDAKAAHFAYVGDSVLGEGCNLGAGTRLANFRLKGDVVMIKISGKMVNTGLRKLGAILGDGVETGCNSVANPGVLLGPRSLVYPNITVMPGWYAADSVLR